MNRALWWHERARRAAVQGMMAAVAAASLPVVAHDAPGSGEWRSQVHGFAAQGAAYSWGNDFIGQSTDGSFAYYEWGLNAAAELGPVTIAAQGILRRVGQSDRAGPRLDFGFVDLHPIETPTVQAGVRYGRVKNPYGLFNDTRDVIFARPSILLPNSVYFDMSGGGTRNFLFSSDGGQAYGGWTVGDHYLTLNVTHALDRDLDDEEVRSLFGSSPTTDVSVTIDDLVFWRIMDEWAGGTWRAAFSALAAKVDFDSAFLTGAVDYDSYVLSLEHRAERFSVIAEFALNRFESPGQGRQTGDGFYVQGDYRIGQEWTVMARYDAQYSDRDDRDGRDYAAANPGSSRYSRYTHDYVLGASWRPTVRWGVWVEQHFVRGSSAIPRIENEGRSIAASSELLLLMVGYRF